MGPATQPGKKSLLFVTNIPTPYRTNFYNKLDRVCERSGIKLSVAYCALTEWNRNWSFLPEENHYEHFMMRGAAPVHNGVTYHLNPEVVGIIRRLRPEWIVIGGSWHMPTALLALASTRAPTKRIFWSEGHFDAVLNPSGPIARIRRMVMRRYDFFAVPNSRSQAYINAQMGREAHTVRLPNTVNEQFFIPASTAQRQEARAEFGLNPGDRVFLQISQFEERKCVAELMAAFDEITRRRPDMRLVIVGTGSLEVTLRARYAAALQDRRIILTGTLGAAAVRRWLHAADIFCLISRRDPNPLSTIEASLCAKPLMVTPAVGNSPELVEEGLTGFLVRETSVEGIKECVKRVAGKSPDEIIEMGQACERRARVVFQAEQAAQAFVQGLLDYNRIHAVKKENVK